MRIAWNKGKKGVQVNARKGKKYNWKNIICKKCGKEFLARDCYVKRGQNINGIKYDNRIENLKLFNSESEHQKYEHAQANKYNYTY